MESKHPLDRIIDLFSYQNFVLVLGLIFMWHNIHDMVAFRGIFCATVCLLILNKARLMHEDIKDLKKILESVEL